MHVLHARVGHLRCEGVAERKCGNYRSGFHHCGGWQFFSKNEMRKLDIFQLASNVSLVADAGCRRRLGLELPDVLLPDIRDHPIWPLLL